MLQSRLYYQHAMDCLSWWHPPQDDDRERLYRNQRLCPGHGYGKRNGPGLMSNWGLWLPMSCMPTFSHESRMHQDQSIHYTVCVCVWHVQASCALGNSLMFGLSSTEWGLGLLDEFKYEINGKSMNETRVVTLCKFLLDNGANPNAYVYNFPEMDGCTAIFMCALQHSLGVE